MDEETQDRLVFDFFANPQDVNLFDGEDSSKGFVAMRFEDGIDMDTGESHPMLRIVVDDAHQEIIQQLREEMKEEGVLLEVNQLLVCG